MNKKPFVTKEQIEEIAKTYPTPFHLYDEKGIREKCEKSKRGIFLEPWISGIFCDQSDPEPVFG